MCTPKDMFNVYGWIACTQKLTQWNKLVFTRSCTQEVIPLHFLSTAWMCCTLYSAVRSIWIDWPLTFCRTLSVMQILDWMRRSKRVLFPKNSHLPSPSVWSHFGAQPDFRPQRTMWLFERWHFLRTIFSCEYGWVTTRHRSIPFCVNTACREISPCQFFPPAAVERHFLVYRREPLIQHTIQLHFTAKYLTCNIMVF